MKLSAKQHAALEEMRSEHDAKVYDDCYPGDPEGQWALFRVRTILGGSGIYRGPGTKPNKRQILAKKEAFRAIRALVSRERPEIVAVMLTELLQAWPRPEADGLEFDLRSYFSSTLAREFLGQFANKHPEETTEGREHLWKILTYVFRDKDLWSPLAKLARKARERGKPGWGNLRKAFGSVLTQREFCPSRTQQYEDGERDLYEKLPASMTERRAKIEERLNLSDLPLTHKGKENSERGKHTAPTLHRRAFKSVQKAISDRTRP